MKLRSFLLLGVGVYATGCMMPRTPAGPLQTDTRTIPRDTSESARIDLRMSAGELRIAGGAQDLLRADFSYNVPSFKPDIRYSTAAGRANLTVEQPTGGNRSFSNTRNQWDLKLNNDVPSDLRVRFGAGEARLNLGSLSLRSLEIEMGAGELDVDLRGTPSHDYDVRIRGGAGEATIHLPRAAGLYARAEGGLGDINVSGLRREGQHWVSNDYDTAKVQIHVDVRGGVGQINLLVD